MKESNLDLRCAWKICQKSKRLNVSCRVQVYKCQNSGLIWVMQVVCLWNIDTHLPFNISLFTMYYVQVPFTLTTDIQSQSALMFPKWVLSFSYCLVMEAAQHKE